MKRLAILLALGATLALPAAASADSGYYTDANGLSCNYNGSGSFEYLQCNGIDHSTGQYNSYNCTITAYGTTTAYDCRDIHGNTWHGNI
jgi:hypothetical protein